MHKFFLKIADELRTPYDPSPLRRDEVVRFLSQRPTLSHQEWRDRFAPEIPLEFVRWFRDSCSQNFEYDLSAAVPDDRLVEDLGMYDATFSDVDMDILEEYEGRYRVRLPAEGQDAIITFGQLLQRLWFYAQRSNAV